MKEFIFNGKYQAKLNNNKKGLPVFEQSFPAFGCSNRKNAIFVGVLFMPAAVTAIIGFALYQPILNDPDYIIKGSAIATIKTSRYKLLL